MTLLMRDQENIEKGMEKGMEIGTAKGMEIGTARGMEIGTARGMEIGTARGIIETGLDFGLSREELLGRLQNKLNISFETAQEYLERFGKQTV